MPRDIRKNMQAVRSSGSVIEQTLGKALWAAGYRYRKTNRHIFGNPDFTLRGLRIAIFADSEFWHGRNWAKRKFDHKTNTEFWHEKIEGNIRRDARVNRTLKSQGWLVIRFWGTDIIRQTDRCVTKVAQAASRRVLTKEDRNSRRSILL